MPIPARWSIPTRFLLGVLILYSALVCALSLHVFVTAIHDGSPLNFASIVVQTLTTLFLPLLVLGIWKPHLTSVILIAAAAVVLAVTFTNAHAAANETAGLVGASLLFLGVPMLGSAIFFYVVSRPIAPARR
jgi:predicted neutral ceramidase superfamily lipid hydrolase